MFGHDWQRAEATILQREPLKRSTSGDGLSNDYKYVVDVRPADGAAFRTTVKAPLPSINFWPPSIGDSVSILFDASSHKATFDGDDHRTNAKLRREANHSAFNAEATSTAASDTAHPVDREAAAAVTLDAFRAQVLKAVAEGRGQVVNIASDATPAGGAGVPDPAVRLARLDALRQQGLVTDVEFTAGRQHILDSI
jgi:hypothetical protein